jgi:hypothetical protein
MAPRPSFPEAVLDALDRLADAVRGLASGKGTKQPALIPIPVRRPGPRRA